MDKLEEVKVMRDPIHGYIRVSEKVIWDCIGTREFQRLRRIEQLGATNRVYHTAEHSRFAHSLGVYEIVRRMIEENTDISSVLNDYEKVTVMLAGLLHDIGHGPFSHAFERVSSVSHEEYTSRIIRGDSEIYGVLASYDPNLPNDVASVIEHKHPNGLLTQMISSQLDADRMDYLLRDAYFTGTSYGAYDLERVLRTIRVRDGKLVVKESGIHTIEDYIMARYHMYWQVYLHPISRSYEAIMANLFKRMEYLHEMDPDTTADYPMFTPLLEKRVLTNDELFDMDEYAFGYGFNLIRKNSGDPIMRDLADRLINRRLFDYETLYSVAKANEYYEWIRDNGYDPDYYMFIDENVAVPYRPYSHGVNAIWVLMHDDSVKELSKASPIVSAVMGTGTNDKKVFYPKELND
ncbi:MAG: HD domain-containing protein [Erysipelotrichales bacterium]|nr:HD domain-containing protein [Erysipelotrichales bacterium]